MGLSTVTGAQISGRTMMSFAARRTSTTHVKHAGSLKSQSTIGQGGMSSVLMMIMGIRWRMEIRLLIALISGRDEDARNFLFALSSFYWCLLSFSLCI
jgi:hypothetical protein